MNNIFKVSIWVLSCQIFTGCVTSEVSKLYDTTLVATVEDSSGFGSKVKMSKEAFLKATSFCEKQNKKFVYVSDQNDGIEGLTSTSATVKFRCEHPATPSAENSKEKENNSKNSISNLDEVQSHKKLYPENIKIKNTNQDAVAIIIGIQNYKRLGKAEFANQDAKIFFEYAHSVLGISKDKIKILTDADADQAAFLKTFRNWLPLHVNKDKTEVFVFYSGHGLPSPDSKSLYLLPHGVDQDLLHETAIDQKAIIASIQSTKPKSVTMFIDSCYSGLSRSGDALLASAKPVSLKTSDIGYPSGFTVLTASSPEQISSSSPELQHGIFSFYLMKGMEGDADINKDGKITTGEMQQYLFENVQRQAMSLNRTQVPQLIGDPSRVLVGR
jgi:hypothetical protein